MANREINKLFIGIWQGENSSTSVEVNLGTIKKAIEKAKKEKVDLLVFPECFLTGYYNPHGVKDIANTVNTTVFKQLHQWADSANIALVVGSYEYTKEGIYNAAFYFEPYKQEHKTYRKRMLYGEWEKSTFLAGNSPLHYLLIFLVSKLGYWFALISNFQRWHVS